MTSPSKKSATKWLLSSAIAMTLTIALTSCSQTDNDKPKLEKTSDASLPDPTGYIPASAEGPAENVPEPRLPGLTTENSEEGALATLEYFWDAAQYARLTGDTDPISYVSSESCDFCKAFVDDWQETYGAGYWAVPEGKVELSVTESWMGQEEGAGTQSVDILFSVSEPSVVVYERNGDRQKTEEGEELEITEWFALLVFDATAQQWTVEWIGLEELVSWED